MLGSRTFARIAHCQAGPVPALVASSILILLCATLASSAQSSGTNTKSRATPLYERFCVLPESYEMSPEVFVLVPGAKRVGYTLTRQTATGLEPYTREELRALRLTWQECLEKGKQAATRHLKTLKHEIFRDQSKIIQYARIQSDNPLTASVLLSPELLKRFEDTLGKELYVAVPDRYNVFIFPKLAGSSIEKIAPKMAYLYKEALYPVSREVFELTKEGIRVIGKF